MYQKSARSGRHVIEIEKFKNKRRWRSNKIGIRK